MYAHYENIDENSASKWRVKKKTRNEVTTMYRKFHEFSMIWYQSMSHEAAINTKQVREKKMRQQFDVFVFRLLMHQNQFASDDQNTSKSVCVCVLRINLSSASILLETGNLYCVIIHNAYVSYRSGCFIIIDPFFSHRNNEPNRPKKNAGVWSLLCLFFFHHTCCRFPFVRFNAISGHM